MKDKKLSGIERAAKAFLANLDEGDKYRQQYLRPYLKERVSEIAPGSLVLDVGCGRGDAVIPHLNAEVDYVGLEPSKVMIKAAERKYGLKKSEDISQTSGRVIVEGGIKDLDRVESDHTLCSMVLQHISPQELDHAISSLSRATKKGGDITLVLFANDLELEDFFVSGTVEQEGHTYRGDYQLDNFVMKDYTLHHHKEQEVLKAIEENGIELMDKKRIGPVFSVYEGVKRN